MRTMKKVSASFKKSPVLEELEVKNQDHWKLNNLKATVPLPTFQAPKALFPPSSKRLATTKWLQTRILKKEGSHLQ